MRAGFWNGQESKRKLGRLKQRGLPTKSDESEPLLLARPGMLSTAFDGLCESPFSDFLAGAESSPRVRISRMQTGVVLGMPVCFTDFPALHVRVVQEIRCSAASGCREAPQ